MCTMIQNGNRDCLFIDDLIDDDYEQPRHVSEYDRFWGFENEDYEDEEDEEEE